MGWDVVDYSKEPYEIKGDLVRSERTQAAYLVDLLEVLESMGLYAAMAFEFVTPDAPHRPDDPRYDLDLGSYALTKSLKDRPDDPASNWHWEPRRPSTRWPATTADGRGPCPGETMAEEVPPLELIAVAIR